EDLSDPLNGSFLICAHHVDASIGNISIVPLVDLQPPAISGISAIPGDTWAMVTWSTDEPATSHVAYGTDTGYGDGSVFNDALVFQHTLLLTDLDPETEYHYQITSEDGFGNPASSSDLVFTTGPLDTTPPEISDIQISISGTQAIINWKTDKSATSSVAYGQTDAYENGIVENTDPVLAHSITLSDLIPATLYHYQITSEDDKGNTTSTEDLTFNLANPSGMISDDFDGPVLNPAVWSFIDPQEDCTLNMTGNQLSISVPAGSYHSVWDDGNFAPRIMQSCHNSDFEIEVKFDSEPTERYQLQGILVEQDSTNLLRFNFHSDGTDLIIFAASFVDGSPRSRTNQEITSAGAPLYMRVIREGDLWTLFYAYDGTNWIEADSFTFSLTVRSAGVFVGNSGTSPPAFTGIIDYFHNNIAGLSPNIYSQPSSRTIFEGDTALFAMAAEGTAPLSYQWQRNGTDIGSATGSVYIIPTTTPADDGDLFRCTVTNDYGSATSNQALLTVNPQSLRVTDGLQVLYTFEEGGGTTINDVSVVGTSLDLTVENAAAVTWTASGLVVNTPTIIASSGPATKLIDAANATNEITIEAWLIPANTGQDGPARIVTLSQNTRYRNFTLGQDLNLYDIRLRTTTTTANGKPAVGTDTGSLTTDLTHVIYTRDASGNARVYINGTQQVSATITGDFSTWADTYRLALGNELTEDRPWLGTFHLAAIYDRALDPDEVVQNFNAGPDAN
ncbi:MAG: DUF1349 domain-containing protein, partial [bacterium]|nr:DUF1349 domain-containing protein [bacterium]